MFLFKSVRFFLINLAFLLEKYKWLKDDAMNYL